MVILTYKNDVDLTIYSRLEKEDLVKYILVHSQKEILTFTYVVF